MAGPADDPRVLFETKREWHAWLAKHHATHGGIFVMIAKKDSGRRSVTYAEAVDAGLCWGWIDGLKMTHDAHYFVQRFTRRKPSSPWSKINRDKVETLIREGAMKPPGLAEVERAKANGAWARAYDSAKTATVPADLKRALKTSPQAAKFFAALDGANRYAILYRLQTAKTEKTRLARLEKCVAMLKAGQTFHPTRRERS